MNWILDKKSWISCEYSITRYETAVYILNGIEIDVHVGDLKTGTSGVSQNRKNGEERKRERESRESAKVT